MEKNKCPYCKEVVKQFPHYCPVEDTTFQNNDFDNVIDSVLTLSELIIGTSFDNEPSIDLSNDESFDGFSGGEGFDGGGADNDW